MVAPEFFTIRIFGLHHKGLDASDKGMRAPSALQNRKKMAAQHAPIANLDRERITP
jgi:hypothetical protein